MIWFYVFHLCYIFRKTNWIWRNVKNWFKGIFRGKLLECDKALFNTHRVLQDLHYATGSSLNQFSWALSSDNNRKISIVSSPLQGVIAQCMPEREQIFMITCSFKNNRRQFNDLIAIVARDATWTAGFVRCININLFIDNILITLNSSCILIGKPFQFLRIFSTRLIGCLNYFLRSFV
mgnify:CR=1 FL=1